jgi:hypothetical protein
VGGPLLTGDAFALGPHGLRCAASCCGRRRELDEARSVRAAAGRAAADLTPAPPARLPALPAAPRGTWREQEFKEYNFNAFGLPPAGGHLHPLLKVGAGVGSRAACTLIHHVPRHQPPSHPAAQPPSHPATHPATQPPSHPATQPPSQPVMKTHRTPLPPAAGAHPVPQDLHADGVRGDGHRQLRRVLLLELRRAVPAAAAPGARRARHLLPHPARHHHRGARGLPGARAGGWAGGRVGGWARGRAGRR